MDKQVNLVKYLVPYSKKKVKPEVKVTKNYYFTAGAFVHEQVIRRMYPTANKSYIRVV